MASTFTPVIHPRARSSPRFREGLNKGAVETGSGSQEKCGGAFGGASMSTVIESPVHQGDMNTRMEKLEGMLLTLGKHVQGLTEAVAGAIPTAAPMPGTARAQRRCMQPRYSGSTWEKTLDKRTLDDIREEGHHEGTKASKQSRARDDRRRRKLRQFRQGVKP